MFRAGAAEVVITPPVGLELVGYGFGPSVGVLDPLLAQVLVLQREDVSLAIVTAALPGGVVLTSDGRLG